MNVLFLTLLDFSNLDEYGIYTDLMREFVKEHHNVYIVSPTEKRKRQPTQLLVETRYQILKLQIGNAQKTNLIEKGISTLTLERKFVNGIKKYFSQIKFDLIIYSTPPITLQKAVSYVKERDNAKAYLLLKDIFPQNAVDLGILSKKGIKGLLYSYFRNKEKRLYELSDYIGCMSKANMDYLLSRNSKIPKENVEICPNTITPLHIKKDDNIMFQIREKYNIPLNKTIFLYGGNLGKPQGIDFLIECLNFNRNNENVYFVIAGSGTEFKKIKKIFDEENFENAKLLDQIPKEEYEILANSCDVGLLFLDKRFTIPNFPSRMLSYMQASMPILAATDQNTDVGQVIESGDFGLWCKSGDLAGFNKQLEILNERGTRDRMGRNARLFLEENYTSQRSYEIIVNHFV